MKYLIKLNHFTESKTYIKTYEQITLDELKIINDTNEITFENKFVVINNNKNNYQWRSLLLEITDLKKDPIYGEPKGSPDIIYTKRRYTLDKKNKIHKNRHQNFQMYRHELLELCFYYSDNIKDAYDVLCSVADANKYNL